MKRLLPIFILIVSVAFVAGCISGEKASDTKTSTDTQTNQKSVAETSDFIIKQSDVPGLTLDESGFLGYSKSRPFILPINNSFFYKCNIENPNCAKELPIGNRNVGQFSFWKDTSGRFLGFKLSKFDTNSDAISYINREIEICNKYPKDLSDFSCASPNIGENSYYEYRVDKDIGSVRLDFLHKNYYVFITYTDEKEKTLKEAIRIAKIVEGRLD